MEFFAPDVWFYILFAVTASIFLHALLKTSALKMVQKHVRIQQRDVYLVRIKSLMLVHHFVACLYYKHRFVFTVHRQEAIGEQDDEGPHILVFS
ncbi:hypothetical protein [Priestia koreensis]|uniref:hypothetical protein n=1 Tax=Priestia koreensis TaxID=284581 RepID=UPI00203CDEC8|nr:hypothetical protein [Priestia koreensis]MCM3004283.1 hypothetical protein [Priestia koreensis]